MEEKSIYGIQTSMNENSMKYGNKVIKQSNK